eukprot:Partr_v1_DN27252_c1_g3_i5_m38927 putative NA
MPEVVKLLPPWVQSLFPAYLTHRSGLDKKLVRLMMSAFDEGFGPGPLAEYIRECHYEEYDFRRVRYYDFLVEMPSFREHAERFTEFDNQRGYCGHVPCSSYLSQAYQTIVAEMEDIMDEEMVKRDGRILSGDHSHKIPRLLMKANGVKLYDGLYSVTNEHGEVMVSDFTMTKSFDSLRPAMKALNERYERYGYAKPELFFTDNCCGDRDFLESVLPSLKDGVVPRERLSRLPKIQLPSTVQVLLVTEELRRNAEQHLISTFAHEGINIIGLDCEWCAFENRPPSKLSLVQVATQTAIYLFRICKMDGFPPGLKTVLENPQIVKVGRQLSSDKFKLSEFGVELRGTVDVVDLAKQHNFVKSRKVSLADIVESVFGRSLPKDEAVRFSDWEADVLSPMQKEYAAIDAYIVLKLYRYLKRFGAEIVLDESHVGQEFDVVIVDGPPTRVATGSIARVLSSSIIEIKLQNILAKEAIIDGRKLGDMILPATLTIAKSLLRRPAFSQEDAPSLPVRIKRLDERAQQSALAALSELELQCPPSRTRDIVDEWTPPAELHVPMTRSPFGDDDDYDVDDADDTWDTCHDSCDRDTRVLLDAFHFEQRFKLLKSHGAAKEFLWALRDAIFQLCQEDVDNITRAFRETDPEFDFKNLLRYNSDYVFKRVRRFIPAPEILLHRVLAVYTEFAGRKDAKTGAKLFNKQAFKIAKASLIHIMKGCLSDPPNITLYREQGLDRLGVMKWRCVRGTNYTEGGVHQKLIMNFSSWNASLEFGHAHIRLATTRHNERASRKNRPGYHNFHHYNFPLMKMLCIASRRTGIEHIDWNTFDSFGCVAEDFGILPVSLTFKGDHTPAKCAPVYRFLARKQKLGMALTPVHTVAEKQLFHSLAITCIRNNRLDLDAMTDAFNARANGKDIFYKTAALLNNYNTRYGQRGNEIKTMLGSESKNLRKALQIPIKFDNGIHARVDPRPMPIQSLSNVIAAPSVRPVINNTAPKMPAQIAPRLIQPQKKMRFEPLKLSSTPAEITSSSVVSVPKKTRGPRKCGVCGLYQYKGSGNRALCPNAPPAPQISAVATVTATTDESHWLPECDPPLQNSHRDMVASPSGWLSASVIEAFMSTLHDKYLDHDVYLKPRLCVEQKNFGKLKELPDHRAGMRLLQPCNIGGNHWILLDVRYSSTDKAEVIVYDSLAAARYPIELFAQLLDTTPFNLKLRIATVQRQPDGCLCGVFVCAFAADLAASLDPVTRKYDCGRMRNFLLTSFEAETRLPFPTESVPSQ